MVFLRWSRKYLVLFVILGLSMFVYLLSVIQEKAQLNQALAESIHCPEVLKRSGDTPGWSTRLSNRMVRNRSEECLRKYRGRNNLR